MNLVFRKFTFRVYTVVYTVECRGRFSVDHRNKLCLDEHSYPYSTSKPKHVEEKQIDIFVKSFFVLSLEELNWMIFQGHGHFEKSDLHPVKKEFGYDNDSHTSNMFVTKLILDTHPIGSILKGHSSLKGQFT